MAAGPSIDVTGWPQEQLAQASPDLLRSMVQTFAEALMSADADAVYGAGYGERSQDRRNTRNVSRQREWDTRAGEIDLSIPKLRQGSYFPDWLLAPPAAGRDGPGHGGGHVVSAGGDAADGEAGRDAGHHVPVEVSGQRDGPRPGRCRGSAPDPAAGRRPVHVRRRGRAGAQGPRGRPDGQRPRPARDRGGRRGLSEDPGPAGQPPPRTAPGGWPSSAT